jgi:hypothetical protein
VFQDTICRYTGRWYGGFLRVHHIDGDLMSSYRSSPSSSNTVQKIVKCSCEVSLIVVHVTYHPWLGSTLLLFVPAATALPIFESINVQLGSRSVMKGCRSSSSATGRSRGLGAKHFLFKKSSATGERVTSSGTGGAALVFASYTLCKS